jgi:putative sterol carrier protein
MEAYAKLRPLTGGKDADLDAAFQQAAQMLTEPAQRARIQLRVLTDAEPLFWCLEMTGERCSAQRGRVEHPDLEVISREETWRQIVDGSVSPIEAFLGGNLRVRGDLEIAKGLLLRLAESRDGSEMWVGG